eukprot:3764141-Rhodomonas_salina.2
MPVSLSLRLRQPEPLPVARALPVGALHCPGQPEWQWHSHSEAPPDQHRASDVTVRREDHWHSGCPAGPGHGFKLTPAECRVACQCEPPVRPH